MVNKGSRKVKPINTKDYGGQVRVDEYRYGEIHVDDIPEDFKQKGVTFEKIGSRIRWHYKGKCPVVITEDGVFAKEDAPVKEAQNQAFFALSILADSGYVSRWRKK